MFDMQCFSALCFASEVRELRAQLESLGLSTRGRVDREPRSQGHGRRDPA